jgi:hypothetical protein
VEGEIPSTTVEALTRRSKQAALLVDPFGPGVVRGFVH